MNSYARRTLGMADVIVLGLIGVWALSFVAMMMGHSKEQGDRVKCAMNLRQIGLAIQLYANDNKGNFPRTLWDRDNDTPPTQFTAPNAANAYQPGGPQPNDVTAAFFRTMHDEDLTGGVFICPADTRATPLSGAVGSMSNFPGRQNLSYSYQNPYPNQSARNQGFKLNFTLGSDFAIAADMNPGGPAMTTTPYNAPRQQIGKLNSNNHNGDGQNVLYADGHVEFQATPFAGMIRPGNNTPGPYRDNIYTTGGPNPRDPVGAPVSIQTSPRDELDSILLPVAPEGPSPIGSGGGFASNPALLLVIAAMVVGGVVLLVVLLLKKEARSTPPPLP